MEETLRQVLSITIGMLCALFGAGCLSILAVRFWRWLPTVGLWHLKRTTIVVLSVLFAGLSVSSAQAATVIWGTGTIEQITTDSFGGYQWTFWAEDQKHVSCPNFFFTRSTSGMVSITSANFAWAACSSAFAAMSEGDVVDAVSMASGNLFSDPYGMVNGNKVYEETIPIGMNGKYLGFVTDVYLDDGSGDVRPGYGWVKIGYSNGQIVVEAAAIDLDGGPMIVGGGAFIPEPSSALLLLVGGAVLGLRRRRVDAR